MKYFKNELNEIFAYDDEQIELGYGADLISITETEKDSILAPSNEELEAQAIVEYKALRIQAVNNIKVTTEAGSTFDGDETSQTRMVRAASLMDEVEVTNWVLADNTVIEVSKAELVEAAKLAGQEQTRLWIKSK